MAQRVLSERDQYYDFKAIDHALTKTEIAALRAIFTRAVITTTSFANHYDWCDLKADPLKLLEKRAADAAKKKEKDMADRALYLEGPAKREKTVWKEVEAYIQNRQPKDYERAVILSMHLHDLAVRQ